MNSTVTWKSNRNPVGRLWMLVALSSALALVARGRSRRRPGRKEQWRHVKLTAAAADALNTAFGVTAFEEGLVPGKATVNAVAR